MWPLTNSKKGYKSSSPIVEACWKIRTRLDYNLSNESCQVLTVTSSRPSEGKTTVAINLACAYAQKDKKVLIIDANLRKPSLHKLFGISNRSGLVNVLSDRYEKSDIIRCSGVPNLSLITCGMSTVDPIELLTSNQISSLLAELKQEYDVIIIDTPPALDWSDAQIVASMSDGVLLVIKEGKVKTDQVLKLKASLENINAKIVGTVFNSLSHRRAANS